MGSREVHEASLRDPLASRESAFEVITRHNELSSVLDVAATPIGAGWGAPCCP